MSKLTKNKKLALAKIEGGKVYSIDEAAQLVKGEFEYLQTC